MIPHVFADCIEIHFAGNFITNDNQQFCHRDDVTSCVRKMHRLDATCDLTIQFRECFFFLIFFFVATKTYSI